MPAIPGVGSAEDSATSFVEGVLSAVRAVLGCPEKPLALHEPMFGGREWEYVKDCIDSGWVSSAGSYVDRLERELAEYTGAAHAIATSNGTAALHTCLLVAGVKSGDEVLLPTLTFVATANAVSYVGATPHFVDSEPTSLGVDAARLDAYLHEQAQLLGGVCRSRLSGARISALIVMHVFGHPADLDGLADVARRWRLVLIEDAAESLGSYYGGQHTGNFGALAALSFNGNKILTTGGGGAVLTNDPALARHAKHLTTTARRPHRWSFLHDRVGYNYRLPNINAALGCAQLLQLPMALECKRRLAGRYAAAFAELDSVRFLLQPPGTSSNYWLNAIILEPNYRMHHESLLLALNDAGYMARPIWTLMHKLPMYRAAPRMDVRVAEDLEERVVNLPSSARLGA